MYLMFEFLTLFYLYIAIEYSNYKKKHFRDLKDMKFKCHARI